ncbi:MAG TPA: SCP2 sterol-binding domain-containing protein [Trueperaceae bacterium]
MTAKELLQRMPEALDPQAAAGTEATIQYEISEPTYQVLRDGKLTVHDGHADNPDLTVITSDENLVKLFRGELNAMAAFMSGKLKVKGDMGLAQRLVGFVQRDKVDVQS